MGRETGGAVFAFAKLVVSDLARAVEFYCEVCGYDGSESLDGVIADRPIREVILRTSQGALDLVLLTYLDDGPVSILGGITAFDTDSLDAFQGRLLERGGVVVEAIEEISVSGNQMRIAHFADPEGHLLEVMERAL